MTIRTPTSRKSRPSGRSFRGLSAEERRRQRRQTLLDAALERFGHDGFHLVGVREVCAEARLTERYFYESFRNREALFLAVYEMALERLQSAVTEAMLSHDEPRATARAGLRAMLETLRADPRLARVLFIDPFNVSADMSRRAQAGMAGFAELVALMLTTLFPGIEDTGVKPQLIGHGLIGATVQIVHRWTQENFRSPIEHILEHTALFFDALIGEAERRFTQVKPAGTQPRR